MDFETQKKISEKIDQLNFTSYGFSDLKSPETIEAYKDWLKSNFHGSMKYLENHLTFKEFPKTLVDQSISAIVLTKSYYPQPQPTQLPIKHLRIAEYAKNDDYHIWFKSEMDKLITELQKVFPYDFFTAMTDSKPVLERDLAHQAGLGWFGKNTCLIDSQKGSFFFIGEIYTSLDLKPIKTLHPDRCGTCTKCIDACPTKAIIQPYVLDATKCISYLTIEKKGEISTALLPSMNDWFFGCDICQTVCPWNEKVFGQEMKKKQKKQFKVTEELIKELRYILTTSGKKLLKEFNGSPLTRARASGLKRNALIVIGNQEIKDLLPEVIMCKKQESLTNIAKWCENKLINLN